MKAILSISCKSSSINTLIMLFCLIIYSLGASATVRYVKPINSGAADGSSWANANSDIQAMINASAPGDSVWVAAGVYKPNSCPPNCLECDNPRFYTFYIKDGVSLFGNFIGNETDINQRDFNGNTTLLKGDFNDDDVLIDSTFYKIINGNDENAYHVILVSDTSAGNLPVTIDGFNISGGNANEYFSYLVSGMTISTLEGGGIYINNEWINITNCFFYYNSAFFGGGILSNSQNTVVNNNIFANNIALSSGGGLATYNNYSTISNNSFIGNFASRRGGGVHSFLSEFNLLNNVFNGNTTAMQGGGIFFWGGTNSVSYNTVTNNYAAFSGGGSFDQSSTNTYSNNIIANNTAGQNGGALFINLSSNTVVNNVIYKNSTSSFGGGIYSTNSLNTITNNTISQNTANSGGGAICVDSGTNDIINNIIWQNEQDMEANVSGADLFINISTNTFKNNILQLDSSLYIGTNFSLGANASGNLFAQNPEFLSDSNLTGEDILYYTQDDGLRLKTNSPALNAGTTENAPETDILGTTRDSQPDIGAYEHGVFVGIHPNPNHKPTASLNAYPNPATDAITFTFTTPTTDNTSLILYAIDGKNKVSLYKGTTQANETNTVIVYTNNYTPGIYCAALRCSTGLVEHRTIIIK
ncbi:MAG: right-handed parallel beta-helix repeat-containing protein [Sphingobacteriales bacterium]|nr:MAG: right-handed parallel beta-helix repeat-containing protein [Sphingobacteriales bacterium]